mgnify:CR=1 FL=1
MQIDYSTRSNLELVQTLEGKREGSVISIVDKTITNTGARLIASRISAPLIDVDKIRNRLNKVESFFLEPAILNDIRVLLKPFLDIERSINRINLGRGSPRDLLAIASSLKQVPLIKKSLLSFNSSTLNDHKNFFSSEIEGLGDNKRLFEKLFFAAQFLDPHGQTTRRNRVTNRYAVHFTPCRQDLCCTNDQIGIPVAPLDKVIWSNL